MIALAVALLALGRAPAPACLAAASRSPGYAWVYAGTRLEGGRAGADPKPARVRWTTTVVDARLAGGAQLALMRGFVTGLGWSEPSTRPRLSILVCAAGRLFHFEAATDDDVREAFAHWDPSLLRGAVLLLDTPLRDGQLFGQDPPRSDPLYGWQVERIGAASALPRSCGSGDGSAYRLTYRTLPDHAILEWTSGVGVTRYVYVHHGTPVAVDVRLVKCRAAPGHR